MDLSLIFLQGVKQGHPPKTTFSGNGAIKEKIKFELRFGVWWFSVCCVNLFLVLCCVSVKDLNRVLFYGYFDLKSVLIFFLVKMCKTTFVFDKMPSWRMESKIDMQNGYNLSDFGCKKRILCRSVCCWKQLLSKNTLFASIKFQLPNQKPLQKVKEEKTILITSNFWPHIVSHATCATCCQGTLLLFFSIFSIVEISQIIITIWSNLFILAISAFI